MDIFSCKIRLAGSTTNEVFRGRLTAPEVIMLGAIHGSDSIIDLKRIGSQNTVHAEERDRLGRLYGDERVEKLFGPEHRELPIKVPSYTGDVLPVDEPTPENVVPVAEPASAIMA